MPTIAELLADLQAEVKELKALRLVLREDIEALTALRSGLIPVKQPLHRFLSELPLPASMKELSHGD